MAVGLLWPVLAEWPLVRHVAALRTYRQLYPLWRSYYEAEPSIALDGATAESPFAAAGLRDIEPRLYRRVIEIRDGMLAVRRYAPSSQRGIPTRWTAPEHLEFRRLQTHLVSASGGRAGVPSVHYLRGSPSDQAEEPREEPEG